MQSELLEHAARVLEHAAGRSMPADALYARVSLEAGLDVGLHRFLECARCAADRFVVLPPAAELLDDAGWADGEQSLYTDAMAAAGLSSAPTVMLAERVRLEDVTAVSARLDVPATESRQLREHGEHANLMAELHTALTDLLRAAGHDVDLRRVVSGSLVSLSEVSRQLDTGPSHPSGSATGPGTGPGRTRPRNPS